MAHRIRFILLVFLLVTAAMAQAQEPYLWRAFTGGRIRGRPAATSDQRVYAVSEDRHVYAFDERTGETLWRTYVGGRVWDSLAVGADGSIYTVLKDGDLVAVSRGGGVIWRFKAAGIPVADPAAAPDGTVYYSLDNGRVYGVSHTGKLRLFTELPAPAVTGPVIAPDGNLYIGAANRQVYAVSPRGEILWNALLAGVPTEAAIDSLGRMYVGTDFGSLACLDPDGSILWDIVAGAPFLPPVVGREVIFAATVAGDVYAVHPDGEAVWQATSSIPLVGPLVATAGNDLLVMGAGERLLRFRDDGTPAGRMYIKGSGNRFIATPGGTLVFGRSDWNVYAYRGSLPLPESWSQVSRDPNHSSNAQYAPGSADWLAQFRDDVEFVYLEYLVADTRRESKTLAMDALEKKIIEEGDTSPYLPVFLGDLASEGTIRTQLESGRVINDYPDVRSAATKLLGLVGTIQSADLLVRLLTYEYDPEVQRVIIRAMGALQTDRSGLATASIANLVMANLRNRKTPDSRLAMDALDALSAIYNYHGEMPHESGYDVLFEIYSGSYPRRVREKALQTLRRLSR